MDILSLTAPDYHDLLSRILLSGYEKPYEAVDLQKDGKTLPVESIVDPYNAGDVRVKGGSNT